MATPRPGVQTSEADSKLVNYDCKKITQALNYLLQKSDTNSLHKVVLIKLLWAADRYHLRRYARFIGDESYVAMKKGPVGSLAKDIIYEITDYYMSEECLPYTTSYLEKKDDTVTSLKSTDTKYLAKTDLEALDFAWDNFSQFENDSDAFIELAHKYPEWDKHIDAILHKQTVKVVNIDVMDFYKDPTQVPHDPFAINDDLKRLSMKMFEESQQIKALLKK